MPFYHSCCNMVILTQSQRYFAKKPLPTTTADIQNLATLMYDRMIKREEDAIEKLKQVIDFATKDECAWSSCHILTYNC